MYKQHIYIYIYLISYKRIYFNIIMKPLLLFFISQKLLKIIFKKIIFKDIILVNIQNKIIHKIVDSWFSNSDFKFNNGNFIFNFRI